SSVENPAFGTPFIDSQRTHSLVDFPVQLIPRESRPYGYLASTFQKRIHMLFYTVRLFGNCFNI
ncbi:hypothetical protein O0G73_05815, partial [Staphylococcus delphini]|uniref:hypothetical protein n=1 Tax=Staphylococcus delphini TaxID=53344 RepID=UPI0023B2E11D